MSTTTPKTVELYGESIQYEATATDAAITPGMLVTRTATGVRPHNVAGNVANATFAFENDMVGNGIDDAYDVGDNCYLRTYSAGSGVYALLAAGATAVTNRAYLTSAGDGTLEVAGDGDIVIAQAMEAVDNSGGATRARIRVETVSPQVLNPASA